jgi:hypothetical protein
LKQGKKEEYKSRRVEEQSFGRSGQKKQLEVKLAQLRERLRALETEGKEKMREQIVRNDLHDDLRENEGAKMTMLDHDILYIRILNLKKEIIEIKKLMHLTKK